MRKLFEYGPIIRAKRQNKNIKAINLAKDLGITPAYLSLIESNQRKPDGDLLLRIQDLLELQIIDEIIPEPLGGAHREKNLMLQAV